MSALGAFNRLGTTRRVCFVVLGSRAHASKLFFQAFQLFIGKILEIDELIARVFDRTNEFVQFQVNCFGVTILRVLNHEHHQERDNGRCSVDDQLPRIGEVKCGASDKPNKDDEQSAGECPGAAHHDGRTTREDTERVTDDAKQIAFSFVLF